MKHAPHSACSACARAERVELGSRGGGGGRGGGALCNDARDDSERRARGPGRRPLSRSARSSCVRVAKAISQLAAAVIAMDGAGEG